MLIPCRPQEQIYQKALTIIERKKRLSGLNVIFKAIYLNFEIVPEIELQEHDYDLMPDEMVTFRWCSLPSVDVRRRFSRFASMFRSNRLRSLLDIFELLFSFQLII